MTEQEILNLIENDKWMMNVLRIAKSQNLKDWAIGAGFVRNKVWDYLSGNIKEEVDTKDIDLVYFDPNGNDQKADEKLSEELKKETGINWEIVNEFYAHKWNNLPPYKSTEDAISQWPEIVTAIGVTLDKNNKLKLIAPYGINDLANFIVRPSPDFSERPEMIKQRVKDKGWLKKWPNIQIIS